MREILFRAKRADKDEWIYGTPFQEYSDFWGEWEWKIQTKHPLTNVPFLHLSVEKNTFGQFTGLTDKNGKKIFEGDIVHILGNQDVEDWKNVDYNALIAFIDGGFCAIDGTVEEHGFRRYALARLDFSLEVIGNIHDNPELLGGEEDGNTV